jgi:hypothetical protein
VAPSGPHRLAGGSPGQNNGRQGAQMERVKRVAIWDRLIAAWPCIVREALWSDQGNFGPSTLAPRSPRNASVVPWLNTSRVCQTVIDCRDEPGTPDSKCESYHEATLYDLHTCSIDISGFLGERQTSVVGRPAELLAICSKKVQVQDGELPGNI